MTQQDTVARAILALRKAKARIAELEARQAPATGASDAVRIAVHGFRPVSLAEPTPQQAAVDAMVRHIGMARCAREGVTDADAQREIAVEVGERVGRYAVRPDKVATRELTLPTAVAQGIGPPALEAARDAGTPPLIQDKLDFYCDAVGRVLDELYGEDATGPGDIVHATCTGYRSPSPVQRYVSARSWPTTRVTHSYHMGCYGAFPAMRIAMGLMGGSAHALGELRSSVDVLHTELSSLHYDLSDLSAENLIMMTLFADGCIRYTARPTTELPAGERGLELLALHEEIVPDTLGDMALDVMADRFDVRVSIRVPHILERVVGGFIDRLCAKARVDFASERDRLEAAIHPGGPVILDKVRDELGLSEHQLRHSRAVLRERGNMVSAAVPHIWQRIVGDDSIPIGSTVLSMAFGPGLTATGAIFRLVEGGAA